MDGCQLGTKQLWFRFVLKDGLSFMAYGAQAIAQVRQRVGNESWIIG